MPRLTPVASALLFSTTMIAAQVPATLDAGPLAGTHVAISRFRDGNTGHDEIRFKQAGFNTTLPPVFNAPPDFRSTTFFAARGTACPAPAGPLNIDAFSIGADMIETDPTGIVNTSFLAGFYALLFSVPEATTGAPGSVIGLEAAAGQYGACGDVFSYVFPGSQSWIPTGVARAADSSEIRLTGTPSSANMEIDGLDWYIPLYALPPLLSLLPPDPWVYFSVDTATAPNIPDAWVNGATMFKSGATIFRSQWIPTSPTTGSWTCPSIALEPGQLGLYTFDDIDALAVDTVLHQPETYLLFSTTSGTPDPIMFARVTNTTAFATVDRLRFASGNPVSWSLDLNGGDIDAISAVDPTWVGNALRNGSNCGGSGFWSQGFACWTRTTVGRGLGTGAPVAPLGVFPPGSTVATSWRRRSSGVDELMTFLLSQNNTSARVLILDLAPGTFQQLVPFGVAANPGFAGRPSVSQLPLPPGVAGLQIQLYWLDLLSATSAEMPTPLLVRL